LEIGRCNGGEEILMRGLSFLALGAALTALAATPAPVSDPTGVYAVIDRVVFEPDQENPERVQVWGVFSVAVPTSFNAFTPAKRGYMYYALNPEGEERSRGEWNDLKSVAGTRVAVAFGRARFGMIIRGPSDSVALAQSVRMGERGNGRVRATREKPAEPDRYPLGFGVVKLEQGGGWPVYEVLRVPAPLSPADGGTAPAGTVRLITRAVGVTDAKYVFEIQQGDGPIETSDPIPSGGTETAWTPKMQLRAGAEYTWRVRAVWPTYVSQPAEAKFRAVR
jgi:hypothetical protein